ncbi:hypothetical protein PROFUN_16222, partial [Planoprotostelium fungivorum]
VLHKVKILLHFSQDLVSWLMNKPKKQFLVCVAKHTPPELPQSIVDCLKLRIQNTKIRGKKCELNEESDRESAMGNSSTTHTSSPNILDH